ncbi:MAG: MFS transporter, partial [Gammaproteobacteria bacterium]
MNNPVSRPRIFYGWYIAAVCVLVYFFTNGMTIFVPQNLFPRLMEEFSANAADVSRSTGITFLCSALLAPFAGALIDRLGVIRVIRTGLIILGVCFCLYPLAQSLTQLYILHALFALGLVFAGLMPNVVLLSSWFVKRRGAVVGLLVAASSLAGGILPLAISPLVLNSEFGWRWGYGALSLAFIVFGLLPGLLLLKSSPKSLGLWPDGDPQPAQQSSGNTLGGVPFRFALRTKTLWYLALGSACLWYCIQAMNSQATVFFEQEAGLAPQSATWLFSLIFWLSFFGKFLFGALSDHMTKRRVMLITSFTLLCGCLLLFSPQPGGVGLTRNVSQLTAFAIVFGLGFGGSFTMIQLVCVETFGQRDLGKILGIIIFVDSIGGALGTVVTGQLRTNT